MATWSLKEVYDLWEFLFSEMEGYSAYPFECHIQQKY